MEGFFVLLIGYFIFLIIDYHRAIENGNLIKAYQEDKKQYAIDNHKPVWYYGVSQGKPIYIETLTDKKVYKGIDNFGFKRWFYEENKKPMVYTYNKKLQNCLIANSAKAKIFI